jgi:hypothetical protein
MNCVFLLHHLEEKKANGFQGRKLIGLYSTAKEARRAILRLRDMPGFRSYPERWRIDELPMDHDGWSNGFVKETHERIPTSEKG